MPLVAVLIIYILVGTAPIRHMTTVPKKTNRISKNSFCISAIKGRQHLYYRDRVVTNFKPLHRKKGIHHTSIVPTYNHDGKCYTLAFRLPSSQIEKEEQLIEEHQRRVLQSQIQISDILYPKPRSKHKYCGVCKTYYEDYKQHVEGPDHNTALQTSRFQQLIVELADKCREQMDMRDEYDKGESLSEQGIFKCLSTESIGELSARFCLKQQSSLF